LLPLRQKHSCAMLLPFIFADIDIDIISFIIDYAIIDAIITISDTPPLRHYAIS
jgi:hypothetical protein